MATMTHVDPSTAPIDANTFPVPTSEHMTRAAGYGRRRPVEAGEVLVEIGQQNVPIFIVTRGTLEAVRPSAEGEELVVALEPGQFTGEISTLADRPALVRTRP